MALVQNALQLQSVYNMEPNLQCPSSALARGVHITEYKDTRINPNPMVFEESDLLIEQYLSPNKLRLITGVENLDEVESLELKVNTEETSLGNFGSLLPNLHQLKLSDSVIPRIRDVGSSLRNVHVMWMSRCGLNELDGISSMSSLKEIYLSYNDISDISPLSMLDTLQILDLEGNNIDDIAQVQYLSLCQNLKSLALEGNPVCVAPTPDSTKISYNYRSAVKKILPHLRILDDEALIEGQVPKVKPNAFDDDWAYLQELQKDALMMEEPLESQDNTESEEGSAPGSARNSRPSTAALRPATSYKPGSTLRPMSAFRPLTSMRRPATVDIARPTTSADRPPSANRPHSSDVEVDPVSELTAGIVICGNPSRALRTRRKATQSDVGEEKAKARLFAEKSFQVEHSYYVEPDDDQHMASVVQELKEWRVHHDRRMQRILESKAPQVLVIDENTQLSLSDSDSDEEDIDLSPILFSRKNNLTEQTVNTNIIKPDLSSASFHGFKHDESFELDEISPDKKLGYAGRLPEFLRHPKESRSNTCSESEVVTTATGLPMPVIRSSPLELVFPNSRPATARAALGFSNSARMRRQLPEVPCLPPRPPVRKS
ncbi:leucine-rich repeat-containing protein 56-like isoform X2 [Gigantopelta aegis]|uniref:leucine-rich repeat-containing protein 56-like isoform X2 n=1 Tax=Gigantopelta aegis TaxID=1735272 RepID=UPI001B88931E|nr:leucine-rich repeat-containing protein 56-like isoform X2 [Gigantopelta aegis]